MKTNTFLFYSLMVIIFASCDRGPKIITTPVSETQEPRKSSGIFSDEKHKAEAGPSINNDGHTVKVKEVLPTEKYVYLYVSEGEEEFWVATGKVEVKVGESYFYRGGLLKTNFESKEYNRTFDKVYLVGNIALMSASKPASARIGEKEVVVRNRNDNRLKTEGSISISEIIKNPQKYAGQKIQVSGECIKLNANIMGRNWIHLKDGSMDDYDFVATSDSPVPEGHIVTLVGTLNVNLDFGAGYSYDLLLENAQIAR